MRKRVFDAVDKTTPTSVSQIAALVRDFAKAEGKLRLGPRDNN